MSEPRTKHLTASVSLKDDDSGDPGGVVARFSSFDAPDREGDIIRREAFEDGAAAPMVWAHDWSKPIGKGVVHVKRDHAVFDGSFFSTPSAQEARQAIREMGELQQWSFGFRITDTQDNEKIRGYDITGLELFEVSPVLVGANERTATLAVKGVCPTCGKSDSTPVNTTIVTTVGSGTVVDAVIAAAGFPQHESPEQDDGSAQALNDIEKERIALEAIALRE